MNESLISIFVVGLVLSILVMFSGILMRSLIPGCKQNFSQDASAAMAMLLSFGIILLIAMLNGSISSVLGDVVSDGFGKALEKMVPFFECINNTCDVWKLLRGDFMHFVEELIHLLFMTVGFNILNELLPTTAMGNTWLGTLFNKMAANFILLGVLAMAYHYLEINGIVLKIVSVVIAAIAILLPIPAIIAKLNPKASVPLLLGTGFVLGLLCAHIKTVISMILYLVGISFIATNLPEMANAIYTLLTVFMAFGPVFIMIIGICLILKGALS